jgi:phosphomannomutase / phosphoglucomutase
MSEKPVIRRDIFRAYDIRGIVGQGLDANTVRLIGQAIGSEAIDVGERTLVVGADARLSSPELFTALKTGILSSGCGIIDLGVVPTPLMYFATHTLIADSGVMLTGSHNPREYNGIKIVMKRQTLADNQISHLYDRIMTNTLHTGKGSRLSFDIKQPYINAITSTIGLQKSFKVVLDCGNGVAGLVAPHLFAALGCTVIPLYCEIDGNFPNHHPDPTRYDNLKDLIARVKLEQADLGIAFDGDADRLGLVTSSGSVLDADHMLLAFAMDILPDNPGARVVYDVKSSHHLGRVITAADGIPVMCKSGHSYVKQKLRETDALLGGEYSAHIFFKHRWYGFDDGMYAAARFLELMDKYQASAQQLLDKLPPSISTPELFVPVEENAKFQLVEMLREHLHFDNARMNYLDGIRADFDFGWGLVRASNTTPCLVLRFEADTADELASLQSLFRTAISSLAPELKLPF